MRSNEHPSLPRKRADPISFLLVFTIEAEAANLRSEKASVLLAVKQQGLSPEEVSRMTSDRESLTRSFVELQAKVAHEQRGYHEREMAVSKRGDALEALVAEYTTGAFKLGLLPRAPHPHEEMDFSLELDLKQETALAMLGGVDVARDIRPALGRFAEAKRAETTAVEDRIIRVEDELDRLLQVVEELKEEAELQAGRVKMTSELAEGARSVGSLFLPSLAQIISTNKIISFRQDAYSESAALAEQQHSLEHEISSTRAHSRQALLAAESKVETLKIE